MFQENGCIRNILTQLWASQWNFSRETLTSKQTNIQTFHQITNRSPVYHPTGHFKFEVGWGKMKLNDWGKQNLVRQTSCE